MKKYLCLYRKEYKGNMFGHLGEYSSKKAMRRDMIGNGRRVICILNKKNVEEILNAKYVSDIEYSGVTMHSYKVQDNIKQYCEYMGDVKRFLDIQ
ncbi:MAG: hypothetical protein ACOCRX_06360 [Candidatus Woesearchaeota archaeon]